MTCLEVWIVGTPLETNSASIPISLWGLEGSRIKYDLSDQ